MLFSAPCGTGQHGGMNNAGNTLAGGSVDESLWGCACPKGRLCSLWRQHCKYVHGRTLLTTPYISMASTIIVELGVMVKSLAPATARDKSSTFTKMQRGMLDAEKPIVTM
jgi:hypothetical protein